ncbi:MAG: hypothetical protein WC306_01000 [Candidatus Paceibacterota bacterium]|jgi:hypothetical protein
MTPHQDDILSKIFIFVKKDWFFIILELLLLSFMFSLGFIKGGQIISRPPLVIDKELIVDLNDESVVSNQPVKGQSLFVASSQGKYYYPVDCSSAQNLSEKNKIYFSTKEEAESRGYTKNSHCEY